MVFYRFSSWVFGVSLLWGVGVDGQSFLRALLCPCSAPRRVAGPVVVAVEPQGSPPPTAGRGLVVVRVGIDPRRIAFQG